MDINNNIAYIIANPRNKSTLKYPIPREAKPFGNFAYITQYKAKGPKIQDRTPTIL